MPTAVNNRSTTAANLILMLQVDVVFVTAQQIQGYSADDMTNFDSVDEAETSMGVDGRLSGGYVPAPYKQNISLQADSQSNDVFDNWAAYNRQARTSYIATGNLILPATGAKYAMRRGFLTSYKPVPDGKKTLQPRTYVITWERVSRSPF